ncbi:MAG TPA: GvpL/GvpF family gas vesicle protein [Candidatus Limnocylindria bacterium]|nr:GvpL/GvpF family gas vesicle protein [Candidatus Limnocylindria bacterium]
MTRLVVHAIASAPVERAPAGLRGAALRWVPAGGLGAWVTPGDELAATLARDDVFDHHRIVDTLFREGAHLPVRFPTVAEDDAGVAALVAPREAELRGTLARVAGRSELALTLLWAGSQAVPGRGHAVRPAPGGPGRTFLESKRVALAGSEDRRRTAEALAKLLEAELPVERADVRHAICPSAEVALSTAILAPAGQAERLKETVTLVASRLEGVRAVVSGPWPPYTFAEAA